MEAEAIRHPILYSRLIHKADMPVAEHTVVVKVETQAAAPIAQKEIDHRKPATPAQPVTEVAVSSEMTAPSQVMVTVVT